MKLPTLKNKTNSYPEKALCPWCRKNKVFEPHSFAMLGGGALFLNRNRDSGGPDDRMDGYLSLTWHGAHEEGEGKDRDIYSVVQIAKDVRGGQYDVYFCSTKCLRSYLNFCVDQLETQILSERTKSNKKLKSVAAKKRRAP